MSLAPAQIDPEALARPLDGASPAGAQLRYDPVYDEVKEARSADAEYLPQGIWQRDIKRADWPLVAERAHEVLRGRSKDLQFAAWLTEAMTHLHGLSGMAVGMRVIARLSQGMWDDLYPEIDDEDGAEPRLLVLEWLDRVLPEAIDMIEVTRPNTRLVEPFTLRGWCELERRERAQATRSSPQRRSARREDSTADDGPTRGDLSTSIQLTPDSHYDDFDAVLKDARAALHDLRGVYDELCGPGSARFPRTEEALGNFTKHLNEAREHKAAADAAARQAETSNAAESAGPIADEDDKSAATAGNTAAGSPKSAKKLDLLAEIKNVQNRDYAYRLLEALATRLVEIDPHSPAPYLARRAGSFRDQTFADLVMHFVDDERMRRHLFELLGIGGESEDTNEAAVAGEQG
mgnify:CR=1 FL=1